MPHEGTLSKPTKRDGHYQNWLSPNGVKFSHLKSVNQFHNVQSDQFRIWMIYKSCIVVFFVKNEFKDNVYHV